MTCGVSADESDKRRKFQDLDENKWKAEGVDIFDMLLLVLRPVVLTFFLHNVGRNFDSQQCQLPYLSFPYLTL